MIASKIIEKAMKLLGYDILQKTGSVTDIDENVITAINTVYADLYYLINKDGFNEITTAQENINLPEKATTFPCKSYNGNIILLTNKSVPFSLLIPNDIKSFSKIFLFSK